MRSISDCEHFTARAKVGFDLGELPEAMRTLHRRGVKGYVTFNTLVFDHEIDEASPRAGGDRRRRARTPSSCRTSAS